MRDNRTDKNVEYRLTVIGLVVVALVGVWSGCATTGGAPDEEPPEAPTSSQTQAAEPAGGTQKTMRPDGFTKAEVMEVVSTPGGHVVILQDRAKETVVPIFVGESQAMVIKLRLERRRYSRPLTHDLLDKMVERLGGKIVKVHIDAVKSGVFIATVYVQGPDQIYKVDARSSDAVAVAVGHEVPIYVAKQVLSKAGVSRHKLQQGAPTPRRNRPAPKKKGGDRESQRFY